MNKKLRSVLIFSMVMSTLLTGCGGKEASTSNGDSNKETTETASKEENGAFTPNGEYPIIKEGEAFEVSMFAPLRAGVMSYDRDENEFTKWLEDKTGVSCKFQTVPAGDRQAKLNVLMTSGNYPDVILDSFFSASEQLLYGQQGVLLPLNDLIDQYAPNIKRILDENPLVKENITMEDGNIYSLPSVGTATHMQTPYKLWINQKWLTNLGLEMPTTTEEFKTVLKAFKEQDPNGNGKADEIPLSGTLKGWNADPTPFLMNSFTYYDMSQSKGMTVEDGKVTYTRTRDEFKDGLSYMNELYEEGLMDSLTYSQSADQLKKVANQPGESIVGVCGGGSISSFINLGDSDTWKDYVAVPPLKGPNGEQNAITIPHYGNIVLNITNACENPEVVIRMFDLLYTEEGFMGNAAGLKGTDYVDAAEGMVNVLGEPARFEELTANAEREGRYWNQLGPWYRPADYELWFSADPEGDIESLLYNETVNKYLPYKKDASEILPPLGFDADSARSLVDIELPLNAFVDQSVADFIMGTKDIDTEWDAYVQTVQELGVETYLEVYQAAYDKRVSK